MNDDKPNNDRLPPVPGQFQYYLIDTSAKPEEIIPPLADQQLDIFMRLNFTRCARNMTVSARAIAVQWRTSEITVEHLLLGILKWKPVRFFIADGPESEFLIHAVEASLTLGTAPRPVVLSVTGGVRQVIERAGREAQDGGYQHIGAGPLLLGLSLEMGSNAQECLTRYGITYARLRSSLPPAAFTS